MASRIGNAGGPEVVVVSSATSSSGSDWERDANSLSYEINQVIAAIKWDAPAIRARSQIDSSNLVLQEVKNFHLDDNNEAESALTNMGIGASIAEGSLSILEGDPTQLVLVGPRRKRTIVHQHDMSLTLEEIATFRADWGIPNNV